MHDVQLVEITNRFRFQNPRFKFRPSKIIVLYEPNAVELIHTDSRIMINSSNFDDSVNCNSLFDFYLVNVALFKLKRVQTATKRNIKSFDKKDLTDFRRRSGIFFFSISIATIVHLYFFYNFLTLFLAKSLRLFHHKT